MNVLLTSVADEPGQGKSSLVVFNGLAVIPGTDRAGLIKVAVDYRAASEFINDLPVEGEVASWQVIEGREFARG